MWTGTDDHTPEQFRSKTWPADLRDAATMAEVAQHYASELDAQFKTLARFVRHGGEIGRSHEHYLRGVLSRFLPRRWKVGSGFIFGGSGASSQQDVLIYDDIDDRPLFEVGDCVVVPRSAVAGSLEVKTKLDSTTDFRDCVEKVLASPAPVRAIYAWDGLSIDLAREALWEGVRRKHGNGKCESGMRVILGIPDYIYVRSKYVIFSRHNSNHSLKTPPLKSIRLGEQFNDGHALLGLVAALWRDGIQPDHRNRIPGCLEHWICTLDEYGEAIPMPTVLEETPDPRD